MLRRPVRYPKLYHEGDHTVSLSWSNWAIHFHMFRWIPNWNASHYPLELSRAFRTQVCGREGPEWLNPVGKAVKTGQHHQPAYFTSPLEGQGLKSDTKSAEKALSFFTKHPRGMSWNDCTMGFWKGLRKHSLCKRCLLPTCPWPSFVNWMWILALVKNQKLAWQRWELLAQKSGNL